MIGRSQVRRQAPLFDEYRNDTPPLREDICFRSKGESHGGISPEKNSLSYRFQ